MRHRCECQACRDRDARRYARLVENSWTPTERARLDAIADSDATPIGAVLGPVPEWTDRADTRDDGA